MAIFGAKTMRRKVKRRYPDLESKDPAQRSISTSDFLHDFVLDFGPGVSQPSMFAYNPEASESAENHMYGPVHNPSSGPYSVTNQGGRDTYDCGIELDQNQAIQQQRAPEPSGLDAGKLKLWAGQYGAQMDFGP